MLGEQGGHFGAHLAYTKMRNADEGDYLAGGHLELAIMPWLALNGSVDYRSESVIDIDDETSNRDLTIKTIPVTATARLYLPSAIGLQPFLAAGMGWYRITYDFSERLEAAGADDETDTSFGWNLGLGGRIAVAPMLSIYAEGRYVFLDPNRDFGDGLREQVTDLDYDSRYVAGGLNLHF